MSIEAMKEALEAFEHIQGMSWSIVTTATCKRNIANLRQAIEQAEKQFNPDWDQQAVLVERIRELEAQQALDKKADNARELGLDYEPEEFVRWSKEKEFFDAAHALPQAEKQEPYCWVQSKLNQGLFYKEKPRRIHTIPLYTAPSRKEWVGLTDEEILQTLGGKTGDEYFFKFVRAVEAKLKEKNT